MDLGLNVAATLPQARGLLGLRKRITAKEICRTTWDLLEAEAVPLFRLDGPVRTDGFDIFVHTAAPPVEFRLSGAELRMAARTSRVGPGYHAFLVDLLDKLAARHGSACRWRESAPAAGAASGADETGYAVDRDFRALQIQMGELHCATCRKIAETFDGATPWLIDMTEHAPEYEAGAYAALARTGPLTLDQVRERASAEGDEAVLAAGAQHFPWWDEGFGASYHAGAARELAWMAAPWTGPRFPSDLVTYDAVLFHIREAERLGASPLPGEAVAELERLRQETPPVLPAMEGIGYSRRLHRYPLSRGWSALIPISTAGAMLERDTLMTFALSDFDVGHRSSTVRSAEVADDEQGEPGLFDQAELLGFELETEPNDNGESIYRVATAPPANGVMEIGHISVWYRGDHHRPLAERIVRSLRWDAPKDR